MRFDGNEPYGGSTLGMLIGVPYHNQIQRFTRPPWRARTVANFDSELRLSNCTPVNTRTQLTKYSPLRGYGTRPHQPLFPIPTLLLYQYCTLYCTVSP